MYLSSPEARLNLTWSSKLKMPLGPANITFTASCSASSCSGLMWLQRLSNLRAVGKIKGFNEPGRELREITQLGTSPCRVFNPYRGWQVHQWEGITPCFVFSSLWSYDVLAPTTRSGLVWFTDTNNIRHAVEVAATTLHEAATLATAEFRRCGFTENVGCAESQTAGN